MQDGTWRALQRFNGSVDQMFTRLCENLCHHIIWNMTAINQFAQEIKSVSSDGKPTSISLNPCRRAF